MSTPPTREDALHCAGTFLQLTHIAAEGDSEQAGEVLAEYLTTDDSTAEANAWALASVGPLLVGDALRRLWKDALGNDGLIVIEQLPGAPATISDHGMAMTRAVVQHANAPRGGGTEYATDIVAAHYREHGPEGLLSFIIELIKLSAFLWQQGAYEPKPA